MRSGRRSPSPRTARAAHLAGLAGALLLLLSHPVAAAAAAASAEAPNHQSARAAYEAGTAAFARGEFAAAAAMFARADELSPNPVALESALKAALRAGDPALGMTLVDRASRVTGNARLAALARLAHRRFSERTGQLLVRCPPATQCSARVDGAPAAVDEERWYATGPHQLEIAVGDQVERREVVIAAGASVEVKPASAPVAPRPTAAPPARSEVPAAPSPPSDAKAGVHPAWFWVAAGVTAVATGLTIASGVDAVNEYNVYLANPTDETSRSGHAAQTRTNVLLGVAGAAAVTTAVLGVFVVSWSDPHGARGAFVVTPGGARVDAGIRF